MKKLLTLIVYLAILSSLSAQQKRFTISGYISDATDGEKLISANIYQPEMTVGTTSNTYGFYSLTLPEGQHTIVYSYIGYAPQTIPINLNKDMAINITLKQSLALEEVKITAARTDNRLHETLMSKETLTMETVKSLPAFMGETDIIKTLQLMPGIQSGSEGSSGLYVRGGGPDQNLILLDGVPVYNTNHLFGFFSVFNTDAIKNVTLYKGGFPARFGGRLSSVLDIRMKEGNEKEYHGGIQTGLIATKLFVEGPIKKDRTAFHVSGRRTYIDILSRPFMSNKETAGYFFYDLNAKVNHKFSDKSRLYLSAYTGRDKAYTEDEYSYSSNDDTHKSTDESDLSWGNITTALRWNYIITNKLFSNTTLTYSQYLFKIQNRSKSTKNGYHDEETFYKYNSGINDFSYKTEMDWYPTHNHNIKLGINYIHHTFRPGVETYQTQSNQEGNDNKRFANQTQKAHEASVFIEDDITINQWFKANIGLHLSAFEVDGKLYKSIEPRVSTSIMANDHITLKAAYSKMQQYLHLLSNSTIGLPTDLWLPVTPRIKPQQSHQIAVGLLYSPWEDYIFSTEGFYKNMDNMIEYKEGASFFSSSTRWEDKVEMGEGRSYGLELLAKKENGNTNGWIGYTWSRSERQFTNINAGNWFPARHDRKHDISIVLSQRISKSIDIGATWVFGTGNAVTLATHNILPLENNENGNGSSEEMVPYFEGRNNYRLPNYHRLDLGINFTKQKKHGKRTWNISVYNAYNQKNPFFIYVTDKDNGAKALKQVSLFPILPSISYTYTF